MINKKYNDTAQGEDNEDNYVQFQFSNLTIPV